MTPTVFLNHDFVNGLARRSDIVALASQIASVARRLSTAPLYVHPELCQQDTGEGVLASWANKHSQTLIAGLLLRLLSGPFVTDLLVDVNAPLERLEPDCPVHPGWLRDSIHHLGHHALDTPSALPIAFSCAPDTFLKEQHYYAIRGSLRIEVRNAKNESDILAILTDTNELKDALSVLEDAVKRTERVRVLEKARNTAKHWSLDCNPKDLYNAILALDDYARVLDQGMSRELSAGHYQKQCGVEMSQESGLTKRIPLCFNARNINVPGYGKQYFDMHAKPGPRTRIHIWTTKEDGKTLVYIGHCGEHLPLPSGK